VSERAAGEEQLLTGWAVLVEDRLEQLLADLAGDDGCPARLVEAMRHALLGGKHLRPLLALAACRACGGRAEESLDVACAVEMIHAYSLVHDDLPAMDDDDFRRGRPACHRQFGEALAILAGDALLTWAFEILAKALGGEACTVAVALLARAAGPAGMVGGQADDISSWPEPPGQEAVESIPDRRRPAGLARRIFTSGPAHRFRSPPPAAHTPAFLRPRAVGRQGRGIAAGDKAGAPAVHSRSRCPA